MLYFHALFSCCMKLSLPVLRLCCMLVVKKTKTEKQKMMCCISARGTRSSILCYIVSARGMRFGIIVFYFHAWNALWSYCVMFYKFWTRSVVIVLYFSVCGTRSGVIVWYFPRLECALALLYYIFPHVERALALLCFILRLWSALWPYFFIFYTRGICSDIVALYFTHVERALVFCVKLILCCNILTLWFVCDYFITLLV